MHFSKFSNFLNENLEKKNFLKVEKKNIFSVSREAIFWIYWKKNLMPKKSKLKVITG